MLRITKQTDYGIVLLTHLAHQPERLFTAPVLSAEASLPAPMVSKILKALSREGILDSQRGVKGGYSLSRPADEITVAEIIGALEGPIGITECIDDTPGECGLAATCPARSNWNRINQAIRQALDGITLADMGQPVTTPLERLVTIGDRPPSEANLDIQV